jgi:hypothetical protein
MEQDRLPHCSQGASWVSLVARSYRKWHSWPRVLRRYFSQDGETLMVATTIYPAGRYSFSFAIDLPGV